MVSHKELRTSVNIELDIGEEDIFEKYLPTPSHADSIIGITKGYTQLNRNTAHIMIGPYGSGKSLLATIIASIVGKSMSTDVEKALINKFDKVHQEVFFSLEKLKRIERTYIPVTLNGSYEDFGEAIIENIQETLERSGYEISLPSEKKSIIETIEKWKLEYPYTYEKFEKFVIYQFGSLELFLRNIYNTEKKSYKWFYKIYPKLTSGAKFSVNNSNLTENLISVLEKLEDHNIGLFIIHDEFGRHLQNLDNNKINKNMQAIQDIAEFVSRSNNLMHLLLISHKSMSQYMKGFNREFQTEFKRVEKRYNTYFVESDSATFYRIVENYLTINQINNRGVFDKEIATKVKQFNLYTVLNQHEIDEIVVKGCYPIHPLTLYILPRISKVFGQNERTLFTYLESDEQFGFRKQMEKNNDYIHVDTLFDYFFKQVDLNDISDENEKEIIKTYLKIRRNLDARKTNAYRIIKFITLWELTHSNSIYKLDEDLISFATSINKSKVKVILQNLIKLKYIRYNLVQGLYELHEGSSIIIEELIEEKRNNTVITFAERIQLLESLLEKKYYVARDYNDVKNITRFMRVQLINSTRFINKDFDESNLYAKNSDGTINYIILDNISDYQTVINKIKMFQDERLLFAVLKNDLITYQKDLDSCIVLELLKEDSDILSNYNNLKYELNVIQEDIQFKLKTFLNDFIEFKENVEWYNSGQLMLIENEIELEKLITDIMWKLYPDTPIIMNDLINRYKVIGIQKKSIIKLINKVLNSYYKENLGIKGQGPEYLIYATIIKNNNINLNQLDNISNTQYMLMRSRLLQQIEQDPNSNLDELYKILSSSPFGIRPPLIPLFIVILLRDKWDQLMFYRNDMYVPALEGDKIHEMFGEAKEYSYVFHNYTPKMKQYMNAIENQLGNYISENVQDSTQLIKVSSALLNWLRSLPKQTQITTRFTTGDLNEFKEVLRKSEINPLQTLNTLIKITDGDYEVLQELVSRLEGAHCEFQQHVERFVNNSLGINNFNEREEFINSLDDEKYKKNNLITLLNNSKEFNEFLYNYIGSELSEWSDITYNLFETQLKNDLQDLETNRNLDDNSHELYIDDDYKVIKEVSLSKKSEIIYNNLDRLIRNAGRNVSKDEINYLLLKLLKEYVE